MCLELVFTWGGMHFGFLCAWASNLTAIEGGTSAFSQLVERWPQALFTEGETVLFVLLIPPDIGISSEIRCFSRVGFLLFLPSDILRFLHRICNFCLIPLATGDSVVKQITVFKSQNYLKLINTTLKQFY